MQCPHCLFENRDAAKFCKKCRAKLQRICEFCGHPYEWDSIFCDDCGDDLKGSRESFQKKLSFDEKLTKIQKYLPTGLAEEIVAQRDRIGPYLCNQMVFHLRRNCTLYSQLFRQEGGTFKAKEQLRKAMETYKECGADGWVKKAEEEMAKLLP